MVQRALITLFSRLRSRRTSDVRITISLPPPERDADCVKLGKLLWRDAAVPNSVYQGEVGTKNRCDSPRTLRY